LASEIRKRYRAIEAARAEFGPAAVSRSLAPRQRFVATASSLTIGAALPDEELEALLSLVASGSVWELIQAGLGSKTMVGLDQSWVRRQYAPSRYPPLQEPHGWVLDGYLVL
jgi:hypothetical protein